jgi:hypothetical protein
MLLCFGWGLLAYVDCKNQDGVLQSAQSTMQQLFAANTL